MSLNNLSMILLMICRIVFHMTGRCKKLHLMKKLISQKR